MARHHLAERLGEKQVQDAAVVGLQDTPPGTAALALAARADAPPEAVDELALVPSIRGAPMAVAERDLSVFTAGLAPPDEEAAKAVIGNAWKSLLRKRIWTALGGPGTVLVDGEVAGLWRSVKKGRKLVVTVEPIGKLAAAAKDGLAAEAERIAPFRGAETAELQTGTL